MGPPGPERSAEEHVAYAKMIEVFPPRPGVVPGQFARASNPSMADRRRRTAIDRIRAERDRAARAEREAEERAAAEAAAAAAAAAEAPGVGDADAPPPASDQ